MKIPEWMKIAKTPEEHRIVLYVLVVVLILLQIFL